VGGRYLSLMASGRSWERPSWRRYFGVSPEQIERLRHAAREALACEPLTREELIEAITARRGLRHLGDALRSGWGTLLKPLAWQGDLCFGPSRGPRVTFTLPEKASPAWAGVPAPDEAAPPAILAYLGAHGPAAPDAFGNWLAGGWFGKRQLRSWFSALGDRVAEVEVDGQALYVPADGLDGLAVANPAPAVRLLPGFDQYVLGPGTADVHIIPAGRRAEVSRRSGWIAPVVVARGTVCGTWELERDSIRIAWFGEAGRIPRASLTDEVGRLGSIMGRPLDVTIERR
jgi:hypothetical protein